MILGNTKAATTNKKGQNAPVEAPAAGATGARKGPVKLTYGGVLTGNMGNIMAGQQVPAAAPSKSTLGSFQHRGSKFGLAGTSRSKLGLQPTTTGTAAPLQPKGNPTGGGAPLGRGWLTATNQTLGGGALQQPQKPQPGQRLAPRPTQRFKIRKDSSTQLQNQNKVSNRRPFAGKAVEVAGPSLPAVPAAVPVPLPRAESGVDETDKSLAAPAATATAATAPEPNAEKVIVAEICEKIDDDDVASLIKKSERIRIRDIDRYDHSPQLVSEYVNEITAYLFSLEEMNFRIKKRYLDNTNLTGRMRSILLDWLLQVHQQFNFKQETMFIAANVMDRFLILDRSVQRTQLQLVGASCLLIAVKYEEICVPRVQELANVSDGAFNPDDVIYMERRILATIDFDLSMPIPSFFLRRCSKAAGADINVHHVAKFIIELAMVDYNSCHIRPSMVAAAGLALAMMLSTRSSLSSLWTATIQYYSRYTLKDIIPFVEILGGVVISAYETDGKLHGVRRKYSTTKFYGISVQPYMNPANWKVWFAEELKAAKSVATEPPTTVQTAPAPVAP